MTFEEWSKDRFGINLRQQMSEFDSADMLECWNAAITSSLNAADAAFFKCPEGGDVSVNMRKSIEKLLTA